MKPTKYQICQPYNGYEAGTIVYDLMFYDYGLANEDTRDTGIEHQSVTLSPKGEYPGFTIPYNYLCEVRHG